MDNQPARKPTRPSYRKHSSRDRGLVEWQGKRRLLPGAHNSAESIAAYKEFVEQFVEPVLAEWDRRQVQHRQAASSETVADIVLAFLDHARDYYPGTDTRGEYVNCRAALAHLLKHCPALAAVDFGPKALKELRVKLIKSDVSRSYINSTVNRIRRCFRWAASEELIDESVYLRLTTVDGLRPGRTEARETEKRRPVSWEQVAPVLKELSPQLAAMVEVQWLTGCRSQSICLAQAGQFERVDPIWFWKPRHKTEFRGIDLTLPIGPRCQAVLEPYMNCEPYLFSPLKCGRRNLNYGAHYKNISYSQAITRAQDRAKVPRWTPHQLRHGRATEIRSKYGVEAAQAVLGHESLDSTELYARKRMDLARQVALETG